MHFLVHSSIGSQPSYSQISHTHERKVVDTYTWQTRNVQLLSPKPLENPWKTTGLRLAQETGTKIT